MATSLARDGERERRRYNDPAKTASVVHANCRAVGRFPTTITAGSPGTGDGSRVRAKPFIPKQAARRNA
jgi:hypothetical protein